MPEWAGSFCACAYLVCYMVVIVTVCTGALDSVCCVTTGYVDTGIMNVTHMYADVDTSVGVTDGAECSTEGQLANYCKAYEFAVC